MFIFRKARKATNGGATMVTCGLISYFGIAVHDPCGREGQGREILYYRTSSSVGFLVGSDPTYLLL